MTNTTDTIYKGCTLVAKNDEYGFILPGRELPTNRWFKTADRVTAHIDALANLPANFDRTG